MTETEWSLFNFTMLNVPVDLPYSQDFETNPESITDFIFTHTGANEWFIGSATGAPDPNSTTAHSLYISNDNGVTNAYDPSSESYAYATLDVSFDNTEMEWHLSFDYLSNGEGTSWDYFSVYLMDGDATIPNNSVPTGTALLSQATGVTSWTHYDIVLDNVTGTSKKIVFFWKNDNSVGHNPPAAVDNISINGFTCAQPTQFAITSVGADNVTLDWTEAGNATSWNISYGPDGYTLGGSDETLINVTTHPYNIDNLTPGTAYDFYVQSDCESGWAGPLSVIPNSYNMPVSGTDTLTLCGAVIFDNGGSNGNYLNSSESYLVLYPANSGDMMMLTGLLNTENCCDYLNIYDGVGTSGTLLGQFKGSDQQVNVISTTGPLTLYFHSDVSVVYSGFQLLAECVSCYPPTGLSVESTSLDGATISWNANADSYVVILSGPTSGQYTTNDTSFTFSGLNSSSTYSVQVGALCGSDTSILSTPISFATVCDAITITNDNPWVENFENYVGAGAEDLICWETPTATTFDNGTFPAAYCGYAPACHSGVNSAEFKANSGDVNIALLPEFTNTIQNLRLSFWATATYTSYGSMEVGVMSDPTDPTTFESVGVCSQPGSRGSSSATTGSFGNYMGPFDFNGVTATSGRIALRFTSNTSGLSWNLDDFIVELIPDCPSPVKTSVTASNIDGHNATITWVDNDVTHSSWTVYYKPSNESTWSSVTANDTTVVLTNLNPETTYDVYVITNCGTTVSNPDATLTIHFTTDVACPAPTNLTVSAISTDEATISWNGTAASYNVEYGEIGFSQGTGTNEVTYTNSITLNNLTPNTTYTLYVNSDCSANNDSLSSTVSISFTTTMIPTDLPYVSDLADTADAWAFNNGTCSNYWVRGTTNNTSALFVTNNGNTPGYDVSSGSIVSVEKLFTVGDETSFNISFDVQSGGESSWDYLKVFFAPAESTYPAATSAPDFASYNYTVNAVNFENYLSQTGYSSYPYKINLTEGNTIHVEVEMPNPNENATATSTAKLVFVWKNDFSSGTQPGAIISNITVATNACPIPNNLAANNITSTSADITWNPGNVETDWVLEYGPAGFTHGAGTLEPISSTPSYTLTNLTVGTVYDVYVRSICNATDSSSWAGPLTVIPGAFVMPANTTSSISSCDITIYDDGGFNGNYSVNNDSYLTIYPTDSNSLITIQGTLSTESCCDYLRIYDGASINSTLLGEFKGQNQTVPQQVSTTGPLTLYFHSDISITYSGFELSVACMSNTCPPPTDLTVSNVGTTTADISWVPAGSETNWNLEYKEATASAWTSVAVSGTASYQLTNLSTGTPYDVRVQADCSSDEQSLWVNGSFTTNCDAITTFPYTEDFEHNGDMPTCWTQEFITGNVEWTTNTGNYSSITSAHGGSYNAYFFYNNSGAYTTKLISPIFDLTNVSNPYLSYWYSQAAWISDQDELTVYYRTSPASEWQMLVHYTSSVTDWTLDSLTLPSPSATYQIAFEGMATYGYGITLDDITIAEGNGSGPVITDPTVATNAATSIAQTSATLNGTVTNPDNVTITAMGFVWKATVGGTYTPINVTGNSLTCNLSGLTPNTSYTYKAFITFNGNTVYGNEITFTTLSEDVEPCDVPTGLITGTITHESIAISWNVNPNVNVWNIQYRPVGGQLSFATSTTNSYNITGLTPETQYEIQVQADCGDGNLSEWTTAINATTTVGIENHLLNSISLYPNPANDVVNVQCTMYNVQSVEVIDVYGKVINTLTVTDNPTQINVSNLAAGMYFVRVTTEEGTVTKSFVKR